MWTIKHTLRHEGGAALPAIALLMPFMILLSLAVVELTAVVFDWHLASEATRRATRHAAVNTPIADLSSFDRNQVVNCTGGTAGTITCDGAGANNVTVFTEMVTLMQDIQPAIQSENVTVKYSDSGLGDPTTPGGIIPNVTVEIQNLQRPLFALGGFMGLPETFTYPSFLTTQFGNGIGKTQ